MPSVQNSGQVSDCSVSDIEDGSEQKNYSKKISGFPSEVKIGGDANSPVTSSPLRIIQGSSFGDTQ